TEARTKPTNAASAPGHPARHATASTVGLLARGSLPVTAFPGSHPSGIVARARRSQLRGQLRNWNAWPFRTAFPVGSATVDRRSKGGGDELVNAPATCSTRTDSYSREVPTTCLPNYWCAIESRRPDDFRARGSAI